MAKHPYEDIIELPHHVSEKRPHMSARERAAQFSPFAALTGYGSAVEEAARLTNERIELDESQKEVLDRLLLSIAERLDEQPQVTLCYFVPDTRKSGGEYVTAVGRVKKLDEYENTIVFTDGRKIAIDDIYSLESDDSSEITTI